MSDPVQWGSLGAADACEAWPPPAEIHQLGDETRLRKALAADHTRWAQRRHALGWRLSIAS